MFRKRQALLALKAPRNQTVEGIEITEGEQVHGKLPTGEPERGGVPVSQ